MPAQPNASKRAFTIPRAAFFAATSALRGRLAGLLCEDAAHGTGHGKSDGDVAHTVLYSALDFLDQYAVAAVGGVA